MIPALILIIVFIVGIVLGRCLDRMAEKMKLDSYEDETKKEEK